MFQTVRSKSQITSFPLGGKCILHFIHLRFSLDTFITYDAKVIGQMSNPISLRYKGTERKLSLPEDREFFPLSNRI